MVSEYRYFILQLWNFKHLCDSLIFKKTKYKSFIMDSTNFASHNYSKNEVHKNKNYFGEFTPVK